MVEAMYKIQIYRENHLWQRITTFWGEKAFSYHVQLKLRRYLTELGDFIGLLDN